MSDSLRLAMPNTLTPILRSSAEALMVAREGKPGGPAPPVLVPSTNCGRREGRRGVGRGTGYKRGDASWGRALGRRRGNTRQLVVQAWLPDQDHPPPNAALHAAPPPGAPGARSRGRRRAAAAARPATPRGCWARPPAHSGRAAWRRRSRSPPPRLQGAQQGSRTKRRVGMCAPTHVCMKPMAQVGPRAIKTAQAPLCTQPPVAAAAPRPAPPPRATHRARGRRPGCRPACCAAAPRASAALAAPRRRPPAGGPGR